MRACLAIVLVACGPSADDVDFLRAQRCEPACDAAASTDVADGGADVASEPLEDWDTAGAGPLSGLFALELTINLNVVVDVETRQLFRMRLLQRGTEVRQRLTLCSLDLPSISGVAELEVPPPLEAVLRTKAVEAEGAFLSSPEPIGAEYRPEPARVTVGAELANPDDPLPTADDPSTALDEDGDGRLGVTVLAETVVCDQQEALYVALRTQGTLTTTIADLDAFDGSVEPVLEQSVLGFSHDCLTAAARIPIEVRPGSSFRARRLREEHDLDGNGNVSCDEIVVAAPELLPLE